MSANPVVELEHASLELGGRKLWQDVTLSVARGEFLAVLGPNGSGKTSLMRVLLGLTKLATGTVTINGAPPHRGSSEIGYVPQQKGFDPDLPITGRDLVHFGLDGYKFGMTWHGGRNAPEVDQAIAEVGATAFADAPIGLLSGGEQQRLRIAQALLGRPGVLICDEPLLSLDITNQQAVGALIDERRQATGTAVIFVTHDINPILPMVDRVLYLVDKRWAVGHPEDVLTSDKLTELYNTPIDVLHVKGKIIVVGGNDPLIGGAAGHHGSSRQTARNNP